MKKAEFLAELRRRLAEYMSGEELADALSYYEEYLEDAGPEGEQEALEALGGVDVVAAQVLAGQEVVQPRKRHIGRIIIALCAVLGLVLVLFWVIHAVEGPHPVPPMSTSGPISGPPKVSVEPTKPAPTAAVSSVAGSETGSFTKLKVEIGMGTVLVETGDSFSCTLTSSGEDKYGVPYELHYSVEEDVLRVWSTPQSLQTSGTSSPEGEAIITLPEGAILERANISVGMGNVKWMDSTISNKLDCDVGMGDIDVSGSVSGNMDIETGMGNVTVRVNQGPDGYAYELDTGMGNLYLNGKKLSVTETEGGKGQHELDLSSGMGDVELTFGK